MNIRIVSLRGIGVFIGAATTVVTTAFILAPELVTSVVEPIVGQDLTFAPPPYLFIAVAISVGLIAIMKMIAGRYTRQREPLNRSSFTDTIDNEYVVGQHYVTRISSIELYPSTRLQNAARNEVREELRSKLIDVLVTIQHYSRDTAENQVSTGTWTDDTVAAAFLGDDEAPPMPIIHRIYRWLYPTETFERHVNRVIDEIDQTITTSRSNDAVAEGNSSSTRETREDK